MKTRKQLNPEKIKRVWEEPKIVQLDVKKTASGSANLSESFGIGNHS